MRVCSVTADVRLTAVMQVLDDMLQLQVHKILHRELTVRNMMVLGFHTWPNELDEQCWRWSDGCPRKPFWDTDQSIGQVGKE